MLNVIWLLLMVGAVCIGGFTGHLKELTDGAFGSARAAVMDIALPLAGAMALSLGIMRLAEKSGLVRGLARLLRPVLGRLFPEIPADDPAMGAIVMNVAANMLGLGNAATALGLRAMQRLQRLNPTPQTATNAMCTFLAINTSSIQLIPVTAVSILANAKAQNPTAIIGTALAATSCAAVAALVAVKLLQRLPVFARAALEAAARAAEEADPGEQTPAHLPMEPWGWPVLTLYLACFAAWAARDLFHLPHLGPASAAQPGGPWVGAVSEVSLLAIPFFVSFFPLYAAARGVKMYEEFVEGAKEGFQVAVKIIPYLVAILVAVGMFRAVGGIDLLARHLSWLLQPIGFPADVLPIVLVRPLSGGATTGLFAELVKSHSPDSFVVRLAGTILGSTETTFYVLAVYFGSVGIRRTRHAVLAGLTADAAGVVASYLVCRAVFGG